MLIQILISSHCPWIDNCVGANNLRHFVLYIIALEIGIILFVQLAIACKYQTTVRDPTDPLDIGSLPAPAEPQCNMVNDTICDFVLRDTFTLVLVGWIIIQLVWITMLCAVQLVQISRNQTTYENMKGHSIDRTYPGSQAFASAVAAGTPSLEGAALTTGGRGPDPAFREPGHRPRKHGCIQQWSSLLGIDAFFATASDGLRDGPRATQPKNPFSRGLVGNCRDFWFDPAPYFGRREPGSGMLGGEVVNYNEMYDVPARLRRGGGRGYRSLADQDPEGNA